MRFHQYRYRCREFDENRDFGRSGKKDLSTFKILL